jgi:monoamine oxidase
VKADVAVVGAGLAGLVAARDIQRAGLTVAVLEARDRVGGRTWNRPVSGGVIEAGGQFTGPTQDRIAALAAEHGVATFPTYDEGRTQFRLKRGGRPDFGSVGAVFAELDGMAAELPADAPWQAEHAHEWDAQTMRTWLWSRVTDPALMEFLRLVIAAVFTAEADELSLLHVLVYIRSAGSMALLTRVSGGAQERRFAGGSHLIAARLAERLGHETVRLRSPVRRIRQTSDGVAVETERISVEARRAIVAVPVPLADRIVYHPALPGHRTQMHQRMAPGASIKINCVYEEPFWRARGFNGQVMSSEGYVGVTFDNSPPSGTPGVLAGFVEADNARRFAHLPPLRRREAALSCFVRYFGPSAADPIDYVETDWSEEEWTRGCFGANLPPGGWTRYGEVLRQPFGLIHWAGAETSPIWMNYMDGAVRSGERAAAEAIAETRRR